MDEEYLKVYPEIWRVMLQRISNIIKKNEELAILRGEKFNLYDLLDRRTDEVKTHSAMIAELLNPRGSHYMGSVFLDKFLAFLNEKKQVNNLDWTLAEVPDFNLREKTYVEVERSIGKVTVVEGGRLDIYIANGNEVICIENKINAGDQPQQLLRYHNHLLEIKVQKKLLLYLTLNGKDAGNDSKKELKQNSDYFCISYKDDILNWLHECVKETSDHPILRESLKQYIILIKSLTNKLSSDEMTTEVHHVILNNLNAAEKIAAEFDNAVNSISKELKERVKKEIESLGIQEIEKVDCAINGNFSSIFIFFKDALENIGIESFNGKGFEEGSLYIGKMDFERKDKSINYQYRFWIQGSVERIWDGKEAVYHKLEEYSHGGEEIKSKIALEVAEKLKEYTTRRLVRKR